MASFAAPPWLNPKSKEEQRKRKKKKEMVGKHPSARLPMHLFLLPSSIKLHQEWLEDLSTYESSSPVRVDVSDPHILLSSGCNHLTTPSHGGWDSSALTPSCNLIEKRVLWILIFFELYPIIYIGNGWSILWKEMERNMGRHTCRKETRPRLVSLPKEHQKNREIRRGW